jgi:enoyl-CoA hydratase/3-hydroxyacyl-CoA dehydrogenase
VTIDEVKKICFVGGGTMGCYNSLVSAVAGYKVVVHDVSQEALDQVPERQKEWGAVLVEREIIDQDALEAGLSRVFRTSVPEEAASNADFLSESVFERLELKRHTHQQFDQLLPPHAIMTTNTSTLLLSEIQGAVQRGDKFAAMHFHQPTPLVDIVAGPRTSPETLDIIKRFVRSQNQIYVLLKKERSGYLHNAMFGALLGTALILVVVAGAAIEDVDRAWMLNQDTEVGPFGLMDYVGLNVVMDAHEEAVKRGEAIIDVAPRVNDFLRPYLEKEHLGMKTGKGFYTYPDPEFQKPEFLSGKEEDKDLSRALAGALISEALMLVTEGYANLKDVDRSWMLTHNSDRGPFGMVDRKGLDVVMQELEERAHIIESLIGNTGVAAKAAEMTSGFLGPYVERGELGEKSGKGFYTYPNPIYQRPEFLTGEI